MASKKATKRENLEERKQAVDKLAKATLGSNLESNIPGKLQQSPKQMQVDQRNNIVDSKASKRMNTSDPSVHQSDMLRSKKHLQHRSITQYDKRNDQRPMTPHFSGFQFNPSDADWLGISKKNVSCFVFRFCRIHHLWYHLQPNIHQSLAKCFNVALWGRKGVEKKGRKVCILQFEQIPW